MCHHPARQDPGRAPGVTELADDGRDDGPLHVRGVLTTAMGGGQGDPGRM
jgi:hypothetical protein